MPAPNRAAGDNKNFGADDGAVWHEYLTVAVLSIAGHWPGAITSMTALPQYDLLEAEGLYSNGDGTAPRGVIVKFGDASLMILDSDDMPVTHWPLATLRTVPGKGPAQTITPDRAGTERLSVDDTTMLEALRSVCPDLDAQRVSPPRSRWPKITFWATAAIAATYLFFFHLIPALSGQMAKLIPPNAEIGMGEAMSEQFAAQLTGFDNPRFCATSEGRHALAKLTRRLEGAAALHVPLDVKILAHDAPTALALPGGHIVITSGLLALTDTPEEVAGVLAHEIAHVASRDPTSLTLRATGFGGILNILVGDFSGARAMTALSKALREDGYSHDVEAAADAFATNLLSQQGLPTRPFAAVFQKLDALTDQWPEHLSHLAQHTDHKARADRLVNADTIGEQPFEPALSDQQWVALRGICR